MSAQAPPMRTDRPTGRARAGERIANALRKNFADAPSTVTTLIAAVLFAGLAVPFVRWAILDADFVGSGPASCRHEGACWVFVADKFGQLVYGFYPRESRWQVDIALVVLAGGCGGSLVLAARYQIALAFLSFAATVLVGFALFSGALPSMSPVPVDKWGGLSITLLLFAIGTGVSFVCGGILALGRRSERTLVRSVCSVYVEVMRGIPLISILFIAVIMLPLFLPGGAEGNMFVRILIGICLYTSAYMAEAIHAGLNAIRQGDREAAFALGLSRWNQQKLVVFPQALIVALPGLINTMIGLVKDTSLVLIVGMHDFLGSTQLAMTDMAWGNVLWEGYAFAALVYFLLCSGLSWIGARLEARSERFKARGS